MLEQNSKVKAFLDEVEKLHHRKMMAGNLPDDYFDPGEMEYLEQYEGVFDEKEKEGVLCFEVKGTQYEGRTEEIEKIKAGEPIVILRDAENPYNANNFRILSGKMRDLGNMPSDLCNAIAPLYDEGALRIVVSSVSFVEPITERSRYARKAVLFVRLSYSLLYSVM